MIAPQILYITDSTGWGGAEGYLNTLIQHALTQKLRVGLMIPEVAANQQQLAQYRQQGVQIHPFAAVHHEGLQLIWVRQAQQQLQHIRPQIAHFNLPSPRRSAEAVLGAALAGVPQRLATFQLVTAIPPFRWPMGTLRKLNRSLQFRTLHQGIAVSQGNHRLLVEQYGFPSKRLHLINNAVDTERFAPQNPDPAFRQSLGIPHDAPIIGLIGRLSRQKGHRTLFAALPQIWQQHPNLHVLLAGQGELENELRQLASEIDPQQRIHFLGQQSNIAHLLAQLDIFVLPSLYEGLSFAVLEALACACAVVASAVDGTIELIQPGQNGLLVPPENPDALAAALKQLLSDPQQRARLQHNARQGILAHYQEQHMLERTFSLYRL